MMLRILVFLSLVTTILCAEQCLDGRLCPDGNTCCAGGCIASDLGRYNATCCGDGLTGCGVGYACGEGGFCEATEQVIDPLVQNLPRYQLCHPKHVTLETVHGFPVDPVNKLAYYSSHGDVAKTDISAVDFVLIVIHGANRNADDYFCAASAAVELQSTFSNVLVVVPRFVTVADGPILLQEGGTALRWRDQDSGPWRYGARSVHPIQISSFAITDLLVETLLSRTTANIVLAGHSSGGQFVQRWTLLTSVWSNRLRSIVANPSSYAYLTSLRKIHDQWQIPDTKECPHYNQWEWGLQKGGDIDDEYKRRAMAGRNMTEMIQSFRARDVVYMIGSQDRCNVSSPGWCYSHGLETSCMDELQGKMRMERHLNYFESLKLVGIDTHRRLTVEGVGHDHSMMLTRPEGLSAIFEDLSLLRGPKYNYYQKQPL